MDANKYIMIVEDNESLVVVLSAVLKDLLPDHKLLPARTIEEAQTLACEYPADLFILDVNLPDGTGLDFLCDVKTTHPDARALVMTAAPLPEYREQAAHLGVVHFLEKPFDLNMFGDVVKSLLNPRMNAQTDRFQGTLRDLHITDIVQIKCMSGTTSVLEFNSPEGHKGIIHFQRGQIIHASVEGQEGIPAFNRIVRWKGGSFSEMVAIGQARRTIECEWQSLLMDAVREADEATADETLNN